MSYPYHLATNEIEGVINGITIRWQASAYNKLPAEEIRTQQTQALLKALTEDFLYRTAYRLGNKAVKILYVMHNLVAFLIIIELLINCP
jgi:hypothetical protein